jgi:putative redox protein
MQYVGRGETGAPFLIDAASGSDLAPGPMDTLLLSLAGCMAVDVQNILERSRVPLKDMEVEVEGERASAPPKRYTRIRLIYRVSGPGEEDQAKLDRAIDLSRRKFCSVLHSLRPDIELEIETHRS